MEKNRKNRNVSGNTVGNKLRCVALLLAVSAIMCFTLCACSGGERVNYLEDNLSRYVYISEEDYKSFDVEVLADPVDELDVENALIQALCAKKNKTALEDGKYLKNQTVTVGDKVFIYYRGYTLDEAGNKIDFDGGCNFAGDVAELEIGSGSFVPGFELNLIGKNSADYSSFTKLEANGTIKDTDIIYVTYKKQLSDTSLEGVKWKVIDLSDPDLDMEYGIGFKAAVVGQNYNTEMDFRVDGEMGKDTYIDFTAYRATSPDSLIRITYSLFNYDGTVSQAKTAMIDLSNPNLDDKWGEGFSAFFTKAHPVGVRLVDDAGKSVTLLTKAEDGDNAYYDITIDYIYEVGDNPLTVDAYFPKDYNSEELRGVTAKFDVYIRTSQLYDAPEFNEAFITETLKLTEDDLKDYEGDTLEEKYLSMLEAELVEEYNGIIDSAIATAMWEHYLKKVKVKKLPKAEVDVYYDEYINNITTEYASYTSYYSSLDEFAISYMSLSKGDDWRAVLRKDAEDTVAQKLVFYYVIRKEGLIPSEEDYTEIYNRMTEEYLESYLLSANVLRENYKTDAEYEAAVKKHKESLFSYYTEDYFRENVYFEYALDTIREWANVTVK